MCRNTKSQCLYKSEILMFFLFYFLLGLVQGLTEFLPVSSSGHLVLLNKIFGIEQNFVFLSILLHVATLLAVIVVFRKQIWFLITHPFSKQTLLLIAATIPTVVIVLLFKSFFEKSFSGGLLPLCFCVTASVLILTSLFSKQKQNKKMSYKSAIFMGISQGIAILPGISRSGTTICTGLVCGEDKKQTTQFSFLMSIPIIICSLIYETYQSLNQGLPLISGNILLVLMAFVVAFVSGIFAIKFMLKIVQKGKYYYFSIYLYCLALFCLFV